MRRTPLMVRMIGALALVGVACNSDSDGTDSAASTTTTAGTASSTTTTAAPALFRLLSVDSGDAACYLTVRDATGKEQTFFADFDMCPGGDGDATPLIGRDVTVEREPGQVMADSCAGDPNCPDTKTVELVTAVKPASTPSGSGSTGLVGETDTNPSHWAPSGYEKSQRIQQRTVYEPAA